MKTELEQCEIKIQDYLYALQQRNLVYNTDFRYFSNQVANGETINYGIPDGWVYQDSGPNGKIGFEEQTQQCTLLKSSGTNQMAFSQALHEFPRWKQTILGKPVTAKVEVSIVSEGELYVTLSDGRSSNTVMHNQKGDYEIDVQLKVDELAEQLIISMTSTAPFLNIRIARVSANVGLVALPDLPCIVQGLIGERKQYIATETPPPEELSLCNAPIVLGNGYSRLNSVLQGRFGSDGKGNSKLLDMRGYFSRAWNNNSPTRGDPDAKNRKGPGSENSINGDHVSTIQPDVFLEYAHGLQFTIEKSLATGGKGAITKVVTPPPSKTAPEGHGKETRPKNIAELYTIKWA